MNPKLLLCLLALLSACSAILIVINPFFLILSLLFILIFLLLSLRFLKDSQTDTLTGVNNLRGFEGLRRQYERAPLLTVVYLDVNELKQLNDNLGHEIGNIALKEVAAFMLQMAGDAGQVYRVGGDEFILISDCINCSSFIDQWNEKASTLRHVGISYGFATGKGKNLDGLIKEAEKNMYTMKNHH